MFQKTVETLAKTATKDLKHFKAIQAHLIKSQHSTFIYNNMIRGYVQTNFPIPAILCYLDMLSYGLIANNYTFPPLIKACNLIVHSLKCTGCLVHAHVVKFGFSDDPFVASALIEFYSSVLDMATARRLFEAVAKRDVVLWTSMVDGYGKVGDVERARVLFDEMPERNVVSWSAMMAAYSGASDFREVLCLFKQMQEACLKPNESVLVSVATACSHLGALAQGQWVHSYAKQKYSLGSNAILATAIVDMYAKCGCIEAALSVFEGIARKDGGAWNAIISGVAMNSDARKSIELFNRMVAVGAQPNETTFVTILTACTHSGLVDKGLTLFNQMETVYNVKPRSEHFACIIDLLARSGMLEDAEKFVEEHMGEFESRDANVWGALVGACRVYRKVEVGNRIWKKLASAGFVDYGIYMSLYNMYKEGGWEIEAKSVRRMLKEMGLKKKVPGCSLIEVNGVVDEFIAGDLSHPKAGDMSETLISLFNTMNFLI
ncbi:hypothetical protein Syun_011094 [Stephania yunnanensis]|uniref:Pentatricopeptide repeat-containing protein n=1 Tax=Stephania yunnanensis TaxID=152371 RepID=A0AAP0JXM0_9MAGN